MKKKLFVILAISSVLFGCTEEKEQIRITNEYYRQSEIVEITNEKYDKMIKNKESFVMYISEKTPDEKFETILKNFIDYYQVTILKMESSNIKDKKLQKISKNSPAFVIYNDGKIYTSIQKGDEKESVYFTTESLFRDWFRKYVFVKKLPDVPAIINEIPNVKYDKEKVNIYFFWGNGCPHCEHEQEFFDSIDDEYGKYFKLNKFEVWYNEENKILKEQFANAMEIEAKGVPFTIIGDKTFVGFGEKYIEEMKAAIKSQYKNSYDVYFDQSKRNIED